MADCSKIPNIPSTGEFFKSEIGLEIAHQLSHFGHKFYYMSEVYFSDMQKNFLANAIQIIHIIQFIGNNIFSVHWEIITVDIIFLV